MQCVIQINPLYPTALNFTHLFFLYLSLFPCFSHAHTPLCAHSLAHCHVYISGIKTTFEWERNQGGWNPKTGTHCSATQRIINS